MPLRLEALVSPAGWRTESGSGAAAVQGPHSMEACLGWDGWGNSAAPMKILTDDHVHAALRYPEFIDALQEGFAGEFTMPPRQVMLLDPESGGHDAFAMLPSWNDEVIALKAWNGLIGFTASGL